jgi:nucleoside-diphosphate-sugar epimerase
VHDIIFQDVEKIASRVDCSPLEGKRILVTGGTGLIGLYFLNFFTYLIKTRNMSFLVDSISKTDPSEETKDSFPNINFISLDLGAGHNLNLEKDYDLIIHAAGYGQPKKFLADEISTMMLNGVATLKLAGLLKQSGTFVFLSTSEVYLGSPSLPNKESDTGFISSDHARAPYIIGKSFGEAVLASLNRSGVNTKIARIALAYGPGTKLDDERILNQLIKRGVSEGEVRLLDQGKAVRTYCYIADTVEMLLNIALFGKSMTYNVGGISRITIRGLADMIGGILNVGVIGSENQAFLDSAPKEVALDMTKYIEEFGRPKFEDLEMGLKRTIVWQRENLYPEGKNA